MRHRQEKGKINWKNSGGSKGFVARAFVRVSGKPYFRVSRKYILFPARFQRYSTAELSVGNDDAIIGTLGNHFILLQGGLRFGSFRSVLVIPAFCEDGEERKRGIEVYGNWSPDTVFSPMFPSDGTVVYLSRSVPRTLSLNRLRRWSLSSPVLFERSLSFLQQFHLHRLWKSLFIVAFSPPAILAAFVRWKDS